MRCGFIGHRDCMGIESEVEIFIKKMIDLGINEFYSGGMGNFDKLCEKTVKKLGGRIVFIPYSYKQITPYNEMWYDTIVCPFGNKEYEKTDIPNRNKWLVDNCDLLLAYVYRDGGARRTMAYAKSQRKNVVNIADNLSKNNEKN